MSQELPTVSDDAHDIITAVIWELDNNLNSATIHFQEAVRTGEQQQIEMADYAVTLARDYRNLIIKTINDVITSD